MRQDLEVHHVVSKDEIDTLAVLVKARHGFSLDSPFSVPRLLEDFAVLARFGAFHADLDAISRPSVGILSRQLIDDELRYRFRIGRTACNAVSALSALLRFSHRVIAPLSVASIHSGPVADVRITYPNRAIAFPAAVAIDSDECSICIAFERRPPPETAARIEHMISAWLRFVAAVDFSDGMAAAVKPLLVTQDDPEWVDSELWYRLDEVEMDDSAVDLLLHLCMAIHQTSAMIARFEVL